VVRGVVKHREIRVLKGLIEGWDRGSQGFPCLYCFQGRDSENLTHMTMVKGETQQENDLLRKLRERAKKKEGLVAGSPQEIPPEFGGFHVRRRN